MSADIPRTPVYRRHFEPGQSQFIITSVYCRNRKSTQEPGSSCRYSDGGPAKGPVDQTFPLRLSAVRGKELNFFSHDLKITSGLPARNPDRLHTARANPLKNWAHAADIPGGGPAPGASGPHFPTSVIGSSRQRLELIFARSPEDLRPARATPEPSAPDIGRSRPSTHSQGVVFRPVQTHRNEVARTARQPILSPQNLVVESHLR